METEDEEWGVKNNISLSKKSWWKNEGNLKKTAQNALILRKCMMK